MNHQQDNNEGKKNIYKDHITVQSFIQHSFFEKLSHDWHKQ